MSILGGSEHKYSIDDVATSLNYGQPMTVIQRRVIRVINIAMYICIAVLFVAIIVCLCMEESRRAALYLGITSVVHIALVLIIKWVSFQRAKNEQQIQACLDDAIEIDATMKYEFYLFNGGDNIMSYVVHFFMNEVEYAVTYAKPIVNADVVVDLVVSNRSDLAVYKDKTFKALYSPSHNDVLILTTQPPSEESEEIQ